MNAEQDSPSVEEQPGEPSPSSEDLETESSSPHLPARTDWQAQQERQKGKKLVQPSYSPVDVLLAKLELFLVQQPEWAVILAAPRTARRHAVSLIAKRLLTTPTRGSKFGA
jgi:hypothetical protein